MEVEIDFGPGLHQSSRAFREHVGVFSERVLIEEGSLCGHSIIGRRIIIVLHGCHHMVNDLEAFRGFGLDRLNVAIFGETWVNDHIHPAVGRFHRHDDVLRHSHDQIGSKVPLVLILELTRGRHVRGVAFLRAGVYPFDECGDLCIGERPVIFEVAHSHVFIDVPGRHLPSEDLLLHRLGPRSCLFIRQQRHWRKRSRPMTDLTFILENRRHIFSERDLLCRRVGGRLRAERQTRRRYDQCNQQRQEKGSHLEPPGENSLRKLIVLIVDVERPVVNVKNRVLTIYTSHVCGVWLAHFTFNTNLRRANHVAKSL